MHRLQLCLARALAVAALALFSGCGTETEPPPPLPPLECTNGQTDCSGTCRDLRTDTSHCGACGNVCASGQACEQGQCRATQIQCTTGETLCNGACVNLQTSASHCGACGNVCASGSCSSGSCVPVRACGDGRIVAPEACDDDNEAAGDGCSASCSVEAGWNCAGEPSRCHLSEVEPNDTLANATAAPSVPLWIRGAITPGSDVDVFRLTLSGIADLRLDTFDGTYDGTPGSERCDGGIDTVLELLDQSGTVLTSDDDGGINFCSSIDSQSDESARRLAAGTYFVRVTSLGADAISAYSLRVQLQALCGDGRIQGSEQCDDGNTTSGDRCSAVCQLEKVNENESNDTAASAEQLPSVPALIGAAISPSTDVDMFRFTLPGTADLRLDTFDGSYTGGATGTCEDIDTVLDLFAADGTTVVASNDDGGIGFCSSLDATYDQSVRKLPAGTYFARVKSYGETISAYSLSIRVVALCGDGAVTGSEECDGSPNCTATCERVQICGDGHLDFPETCEDGNTADGDGCSRTCTVPGLQSEVEPNNTRTEADARAGASQPVLITGSTGFSSMINAEGDVDLYKMQLQASQVVRLESYRGGIGRCLPGLDSILRLENTDRTLSESDDDGGLELCSALTLSLPAGAYYVGLESWRGSSGESYLLEVTFQTNAGSESENNDTRASADPLSGPDSVISGSIPATTDADYFRISVTQGQFIRAEIIEGGAKSCSDSEMESELALFNEAGEELATDTFGGRGSCSMIDGRETWYSDAGNLPAGNYYLRVRSRPGAAAGKETFDYRLSVTVR